MSEQLKKEIKDLKEVVDTVVDVLSKSQNSAPPQPPASPAWTKYIGYFITVGVLVASGITGWATLKSAVAENSKDLAKQEEVLGKHSSEIENVKLRTVVGGQDVKHIKETIEKMDKKIDKLLEGR